MDRGGDGRGLVELGAEGRGVVRAGRRLGRAWIGIPQTRDLSGAE